MALYRYEAIDKSGKVLRGVMNARNEQQVIQKLADMGFSVRGIYDSSGVNACNASPNASSYGAYTQHSVQRSSVPNISKRPLSVKSKVHLRKLASFFRQLATMVRSGVPLAQSLHEIAPIVRDSNLVNLLPGIQEHLGCGHSLSSALARHTDVFPAYAIAAIWCGELSGKLDVSLDDVASDLEREAADTSYGRVGWGLIKLSLICFVFAWPITNLTQLLLPVLNEANKRAGDMSPNDVLTFLGQIYFKNMFWKSLFVSLVLIAIWIIWGHIKRIGRVRWLLDSIILYVPIWGNLVRYRSFAKFFKYMDLLMEAGLSPKVAWDAASLTPKNNVIAQRLRDTGNILQPDAPLTERMAISGVFDADDISYAVTGERTGRIPEAFANLAIRYESLIESQRAKGKIISFTCLTTSSLILGGYIMIRMWSSYAQLVFNVAEYIGR